MKNSYKIGFIGAGKVGTTLGVYFTKNGIDIMGYYSKTFEHAEAAAVLTSSNVYASLEELAKACNLIFITTPDAEIPKVWQQLSNFNLREYIIIHTSGALSSKVFLDIEKTGAHGFSVHPMYAFAYKDGRLDGLKDAFFTIEGEAAKLLEVRELLEVLGNTILIVNDETKPLYHLANVMASNLILALIKTSVQCFTMCGIDENNALEALMPLIQGNIANIGEKGLVGALTGPVERNDITTIEKHLRVVPKAFEGIYRQLSLELSEVAKEKHPGIDYSRINKILTLAERT